MRKINVSLVTIALCGFVFDVSARFVSTDPVQAEPNTGQNFNRYYYANNNPYKFTDPDGRQACMICRNPVAFINEGMKSPDAQKSLNNAVATVVVTNTVLAAPLLVATAPGAAATMQTATADVAVGVMSNPQSVASAGAIVADVVAGYFVEGPPPMTPSGAAAYLTAQAVKLTEVSMPTQKPNNPPTATSEIPDPPDKLVEPR
jgi:hypothetical protein